MCRDKYCFVFFLLISINGSQCRDVFQTKTGRLVTTSVGDIQGELDSDRGYYKFLGIPYGQVSLDNPFGESTRYGKFDGVFNANDDSVVCPHMLDGEAVGSPECLNLHVYVPTSATAASQLPVIFWIHEGYFMRGRSIEAILGPKFLVRLDVIFVAANYRTGPFGFMCLDIDLVPGNQGLKDQHFAMEWVHENIAAFGGDPEQITLAGSGTHSIDLHLISERDRLFNKVIMQSGSSLAGTVLYKPDRQAATKIAEQLGLLTNTSREAVSLLATKMDAHSIVRAASELDIQFKPCVEWEFSERNRFIAQSWINAPVEKVSNIPILIGFSEYERLLYHINEDDAHFENMDIFTERLNQTFDFNDARTTDGDRLETMVDNLRRFYLGDSYPSRDEVWAIINFDSDFVYNHPIQRSIKKFLIGGASDIFYYMFAYSGARNYHQDLNNVTIEAAGHNDELAYLFEMSDLSETVSTADQLVIDQMTTMWTNFAKYGNPTPQTTPLLPLQWTPLTSDIYHYMEISSELSMERRPFNRRMAYFDVFYKYNKDYQRSFEDEGPVYDSGTINAASLMTLLSVLFVLFF